MVGTRYRMRTAEVEFTFIESDGAGQVVVPLPTGPVTWSSTPFGDVRRQLHGVTSRVIPLTVLTQSKSAPREDAVEAANDRADFEARGTDLPVLLAVRGRSGRGSSIGLKQSLRAR